MPPRRSPLLPVCFVVAGLLFPIGAIAQIRSATLVSGLTTPLAFVQDPSDPSIQYVVEQGGRIRIVRNGAVWPTDFLNLAGSIVSGGEQGLLGLAFPPDYGATGRFYVNFTNLSGDTVVARFKRSAAAGVAPVADPSSRLDLLWSTGERVIRQPFANHNGGNLEFGPDGFLYIGMGDGGSGNDPGNRAQDPTTLLGKMLRIDVSVPDSDPKGFRIPPDNPFLAGTPIAAQPEIWDFGLRNPWRFSFDTPSLGGTGALVIGDVGQGSFEEVDYEPAAAHGARNYGWRIREGLHPNVTTLPAAFLPLTDPIFEYPHPTGVAVIGGFVYRGRALGPSAFGRYFFADLNGRVWSLGLRVDPATGAATVTDQLEHTTELGGTATLGNLASFGVDASGELYLVSTSTGTIIRLVPLDTDGDGLPDWWETQFGLDPTSAAGDNGASGDPDHDGRTNLQEYMAGTNPRGFVARYFAEGAVSTFFDVFFALFNPNAGPPAHVLMRYLRTDGTVGSQYVSVPALTRVTLNVKDAVLMSNVSFSTVIESDLPVVVDRTMKWDATAYGGHAETAVAAPALTWYLAEGATHSGFQLYYLVANPNPSTASVQVSYLRPAPAPPVVKTYQVGPTSRLTIFVNNEDPALASSDLSAVVTSLNDQPIVVERAMYLSTKGLFFGAGHGSAAVTSPATHWILPEGATGPFFSCYLLLANPGALPATVDVQYLLPGGRVITKTRTVAPSSRLTIFVNADDPALAATSVSTEVTSTNGVPVIAERAMWWPGQDPAAWQEAHDSTGSVETGVKWGLAEGEQGGAANTQTYVLIANTSAVAGSAMVSLFFEDGTRLDQTVALAARSRTTVHAGTTFAASAGRRFSAIVESLGATPAQIVVERAVYWDSGGVVWAAGTDALGVKLQ